MRKYLILIGHLFFLSYIVFTFLFHKERILFNDSAYYLFKIINAESFNIEYQRFPAVFTQLFTVIALKLNLPLKSLVMIFSVSFAVFYYLIFLIAVYFYRNAAAGIVLALTLCISIRYSFFHPVTETHQALVFSCLFFAWIFAQRHRPQNFSAGNFFNLLTGFFMIICAAYSHAVALFTISFCILFYVLETKRIFSFPVIGSFCLIIFYGLFKYLTTPSGNYEGQFLSQILKFPELIPQYSTLYSKWFYEHFYKRLYRLPFYLIIASSIFYLLKFDFIKMVFVPAFYFGFILFTHLLYNAGDSQVMMERAYMPLAFFAGIPFMQDVISRGYRFHFLKSALVVAMLVYGMNWIYKTSEYFTQRLQYMEQFFELMEQKHTQKLIITWDKASHQLINVPWAFGVETLLYSTMINEQKSKTVFIWQHTDFFDVDLEDEKLFMPAEFRRNETIEMLNPRYFTLPAKPYYLSEEEFLFEK